MAPRFRTVSRQTPEYGLLFPSSPADFGSSLKVAKRRQRDRHAWRSENQAVLVKTNRANPIVQGSRRRGVENKLVLGTGSTRKPDKVLIRRILKAMKWVDQIKFGQGISDIAASESVSPEYITHNLGLGLLSPGILRAIASGYQRADISAFQLSKMTIPVDWSAQNSIFLEQYQLP